jgi:hypothetical protein
MCDKSGRSQIEGAADAGASEEVEEGRLVVERKRGAAVQRERDAVMLREPWRRRDESMATTVLESRKEGRWMKLLCKGGTVERRRRVRK